MPARRRTLRRATFSHRRHTSPVALPDSGAYHQRMSPASPDHKRYFIDKLGVSERLMERCLAEALSAGGEYADLYFESVTSTSLGVDEGFVKTASQGISVGCGIRVLSGERTGFAYTDDLSSEHLMLKAARTAALIANGPARLSLRPGLYPHGNSHPAALPRHGRHRRRRPSAAKLEAHRARRQGRPRLRPAHHAGPRRPQRRAPPHPHRRLRRHLRLGHPTPRPLQRLRHRRGHLNWRAEHRARHQRRRRPGRTRLLLRRPRAPEHFAHEAARTAILQLGAVAAHLPARWKSSSAPAGPASFCMKP